ncbi:MAG: SDR family NAD(P)-dependent oxidoreductase [Endomicrobia bacterium]|nr:SDR family NAD(P)-dependent oxidoreductase [Endomicrobiia bacterium]MCL2506161.1 SDR family NAD(P)-dependent oxidoreductase [Endomicrobiia bacterium]
MNVLIIGATSGIGRGLALYYLEKGCKVAVTGRRTDLLASLKEKSPDKVFTFINDITAGKASQVIDQADKEIGRIDIIIICAGFGENNIELKADFELKTVNTNVFGFTDYAVASYNYLKSKSGGTLAAISSIASLRGGWSAPSYYASKAYVSNYLEGLRIKNFKEKANIAVCNLIPGFVDTALAKGVGDGDEGLFWVAPVDKAVKQIAAAIDKKKPYTYITKRWRFIAWAMKILPYWFYRYF